MYDDGFDGLHCPLLFEKASIKAHHHISLVNAMQFNTHSDEAPFVLCCGLHKTMNIIWNDWHSTGTLIQSRRAHSVEETTQILITSKHTTDIIKDEEQKHFITSASAASDRYVHIYKCCMWFRNFINHRSSLIQLTGRSDTPAPYNPSSQCANSINHVQYLKT